MRWVSLHVEVRRAIEMTQTHSKAWIFKYNHKRQERETQQQALKIKLRYNWLCAGKIEGHVFAEISWANVCLPKREWGLNLRIIITVIT
ncbi:hypothetical protein F2Q70_00001100 [Brassica cretica]|uniref:Uncharacterized protein n=1 Tax=Brassica cretica TaxID=69181 RepID=A0A8S9IRA7_BRACR|nr:hypothetical protein F2Q70_00001100 [Brassica cretica]